MPNKLAIADREAAIAQIAARQHGVITRAQLVREGILPSGISDRVKAGRLHRIYRGVYALGHRRLSSEGRWMAAVLACGKSAVLSHRSAAALWRMIRTTDGPVDVTVPGDGGRARRRGIRVHRSQTLAPTNCTRRNGIPVTKPRRTLTDIRHLLSPAQFNSAVREAEFLKLPIGDPYGDRGGKSASTDRTRTKLESMFLALFRHHRLPQPEVNVKVDRFEVDFLWRDERLIVEVDGWDSHRSRSAFEEDRRRDARLKLLGYEVLRFTWRQVEDEARTVAKTVRALLRRSVVSSDQR
jgi:very-short-patch-repair endonuclease